MKPSFTQLALLGLAFFPWGAAQAAFSPAVVAADARWVVYADGNRLRESVLGQELLAWIQRQQAQAAKGGVMLDYQRIVGLVGSITAYGANLSTDQSKLDGTLVIQGTTDLRKIAESLLLQATIGAPQNVVEVTDLPFAAYAIRPGPQKKDAVSTDILIAFPSEPVVLVSKSRPQLLKALDVVRGRSASLVQARNSPLVPLLTMTNDTVVFAASIVPSEKLFPDNAPQARILQMASSGSLSLGERGAETFAHAELKASSAPMAEKLRKIVEGMTAMMSLAESSDNRVSDFLNAVRVAMQGDVVTLDLSYPSARLVQMMESWSAQPRKASPPTRPDRGNVVATWQGDQGTSTPAEAVQWQTVEKVRLVNGANVSVTVQPNEGKNVRLDRVEITSTQGAGAPLIFRAEHMRLAGFRTPPAAPGTREIRVYARAPNSSAQFVFPGAEGEYTIRVGYAGEPVGEASFSLSIKPPGSSLAGERKRN